MLESGIVTDTKGTLVVVKMKRTEACNNCKACSVGLEEKDLIIEAFNECEAKTGDSVMISLHYTSFLKAVIIMYIIPLIALLGGIGIGYFIGTILKNPNRDYISIGIGIIFVAGTYIVIKKNESNLKKKNYTPRAIKIIK